MGKSIEQLTSAISAGDREAIEIFYRRYFDWLYSQARLATRRDESFCLDVVQDAVLRIVRLVQPVKTEGQFLEWMRLVVRTTALDRLRAETRRKRREAAAAVATAGARPQTCETADIDWLKQEIARLDPKLVYLIDLRFSRQWTLGRIAQHLGVSIATVDGRLRRALAHLRRRGGTT